MRPETAKEQVMKNNARVVIIGGGVIGCSILYHLTQMGWKDVVLVEKDELTSGSTWLAAGNTVLFSANRNMNKIQKYGIEISQRLDDENEQPTGWRLTGAIRLAYDSVRMDEYRHTASKDKTIGIRSWMVSPSEMKDLYPLLNTDGLVGGLYHPDDGHVDPASLTQAFAKAARAGGAEIYRFNAVEDVKLKPNGEWEVHTQKGVITCEYVVNAAGLWANKIGAMVGLDLPIIPMEHQHLLFEDLDVLKTMDNVLPSLRDPDVSYYLRQEGMGLLIGPYEPHGVPWRVNGVENDYSQRSLPSDLNRIEDIMLKCLDRVPVLQEVGIKHISNGPITYTPDGNALVGPVYGLRNFIMAAGFSYGITQAAGIGKCVSEWIIEGEPEWDMLYMDPRRFGDFATKDYTLEKIQEVYRMEYALAYPHEEREAARPLKTSPIHSKLDAQGAKWGVLYGWERPAWFATNGSAPVDEVTFRRANFFNAVGEECKAAAERAAVLDLTGFSKFEVSGPGSAAFLDKLICNRLPKKDGRITVAQMLTPKGMIECDTTIAKINDDLFYVVTGAPGEKHDLDWMMKHMPDDGVEIRNVTYRYGALILVGPKSRDILAKLTDADLSNETFPFLSMKEMIVKGVPLRALRLNFVGELGWELHHPVEYQNVLYDALMAAGEEFGIVNFGTRAMDSMRIEKGYASWRADLTPDVSPLEAGLERFVKFDKEDFIGKDAVLKLRDKGVDKKLVTVVIEGNDADPYWDEAIFSGDEVVGRVSSGGYGHRVGKSIALAYVNTAQAVPGTRLEIDILGERHPVEVVPTPIYDPENIRLKA